MDKLKKNEVELVGSWVELDGAVQPDEVCLRIKFLVENSLDSIKSDPTHWRSLYRDPIDGRLWELTYPQSELHGGGPESLTCISDKLAKERYGVDL